MHPTASGSLRHDVSWTPYEDTVPVPSVMLLLDHRAPSKTATVRAARLATALGARLKIVDVMPAPPSGSRRRRGSPVAPVSTIPLGDSQCDVELLQGDLRALGSRRAHEYRPELVVVGDATSPAVACELVDATGTPVLIARELRPEGIMLAATDMLHLTYPVISVAIELAKRAARGVALFHNATPYTQLGANLTAPGCRYASISDLIETAVAAKTARLRGFAGKLEDAEVIIERDHSTEDAIARLVETRQIDVVVVGRRVRSWIGRVAGHHVTERLIERCACSLLVVPVAHAA